jgi:signal transduction histidine kinase
VVFGRVSSWQHLFLTVSYYILVISLVFLALYILRNSNRSLLGVSAGGGLILTALILAISYIVPFLASGVDAVILAGMSAVLLCVVAAFFYMLSHVYFVRHAPPKLLTIGILLPIVPVLIMLGTDYLVAGSYQSVCSDVLWGGGRNYVYAYLLWIGLANIYALLYARARSLVKSVTIVDALVLVGSLLFIGLLASIVFQSGLYLNYILGTLYLLSIGIAYIALSGRSGGSKLVSSGILTPLLVVVLTSFVLIEDLALAKQMVVIACVLVLIVGYVLDRLIRTQSVYEQTLKEKNSELTQLNKSKNEFLSFATHQLKAPLTAIKWGMGALKDSKLDSNQGMIVSQIVVVTNQMVRTVSDFLNSAKLESGQLVLNTAPTDISALAQKIIDEFRPIAKSKKVDIEGVFPKEKMIIDIDESKMEQVFANLVDNALKYTPSGSGYFAC